MKFYVGTDNPAWLWADGTDVPAPLFVSHRRLRTRVSDYPDARRSWVLDSGGFTELNKYGEWRTTPTEYVDAIRVYQRQIGRLEWCAPQDWMCEPWVVEKTGLTVTEHQRRTVASVTGLRAAAPDLPIVPVLQGWTHEEYMRCAEMYADAGIDLATEPVVGLGSVCRRQAMSAAEAIVVSLHNEGIALHGFGVKVDGLARYGWALTSADSMAWSYTARMAAAKGRGPMAPDCEHKSCSHCPVWAGRWKEQVLDRLTNQQLAFATGC